MILNSFFNKEDITENRKENTEAMITYINAKIYEAIEAFEVEDLNDKKNYILGLMLTYLSFPPMFGFVVGIYNIIRQIKTTKYRNMIILSAAGIVFSLVLTINMIMGFVLEL